MLYYFELYMHHNYYFRRKQHSYAACDAALAASIYIYISVYKLLLLVLLGHCSLDYDCSDNSINLLIDAVNYFTETHVNSM